MSDNFANFSDLGYEIIREINRNSFSSKISYLAKNTKGNLVFIKQFKASFFQSEQSIVSIVKEELKLLKSLDYPGIINYIDCFEIPKGFCLVREYKNDAQSLSDAQKLNPQQIKQIAISILEILIYIHNYEIPVIHQNIKPSNILIDEELQVYLVDFQYALLGNRKSGNIVAGKARADFVAPELISGRKISPATDLYCLGVTLICLLLERDLSQINNLADREARISFQSFVSNTINWQLIEWLEKMIEPDPTYRFPNATTALAALQSIQLTCLPKVSIIPDFVKFQAINLGEILSENIIVSNLVPESSLKCNWKIIDNDNNLQNQLDWISIDPSQFESNWVRCKLSVDTSKLAPGEKYQRQILLEGNFSGTSYGKTPYLNIEVETLPPQTHKIYHLALGITFFLAFLSGCLLGILVASNYWDAMWHLFIIPLIIGLISGIAGTLSQIEILKIIIIIGIPVGVALYLLIGGAEVLILVLIGFIVGSISTMNFRFHRDRRFSKLFSINISWLTATLGIILGIAVKVGLFKPVIILGILGTGGGLVLMLKQWRSQQEQLISNSRKSLKN